MQVVAAEAAHRVRNERLPCIVRARPCRRSMVRFGWPEAERGSKPRPQKKERGGAGSQEAFSVSDGTMYL